MLFGMARPKLPFAVSVAQRSGRQRLVKAPLGVILRIALLLVSATKMLPPESTAIPRGSRKRAPAPVPSVAPPLPDAPMPASVVTILSGVILRITWFEVSATNRLPRASSAMPSG